jgi:hypothetical protein
MSNMAEIVSPYGDTIETTTALTQSTPVAKFAYEFCTEFNVQVLNINGQWAKELHSESYQQTVYLLVIYILRHAVAQMVKTRLFTFTTHQTLFKS